MLKIAPKWYVKSVIALFVVSLLGFIPALYVETQIWIFADWQITKWLIIGFVVSLVMMLLYKDTRKFVLMKE